MSVKLPAPFFESQIIKPFNKEIGEQNRHSSTTRRRTPRRSSTLTTSIATCKMSDRETRITTIAGAIIDEEDGLPGALAPPPRDHQFFLKLTMRACGGRVKRGVAAPPNGPLPPQPNITFVADSWLTRSYSRSSTRAATVGGDVLPLQRSRLSVRSSCAPVGYALSGCYQPAYRFEDAAGKQTVIDDYKTKQSMLINVTDGKETCQSTA